MSIDISKKTFDPIKDFAGVLMQQGRVQLDSDWNENVEILDRRWRAETTDIIGRAVVPKETPDGFNIGISGSKLTIGPGRMYVDGLLAENHGKQPFTVFDEILAEVGSQTEIFYEEQPYLPNIDVVSPQPSGAGPHLVYLDVWQRQVSSLEDEELVEKAVGVDTTGRLQTVWQVKTLPNVGSNVTCATPDDQIPGWRDEIRPSAGRLTTGTVAVSGDDNECLIPPNGGFRGLENRLYRVEIHEGGAPGTATFKWSRDNASVATGVTAIPALGKLIVETTGRDSYLRFSPGDWVEITDDWRELAGKSGLIRKVKSVDDATQTITLESTLPAGEFPTDAQGNADPARHTRVTRWDQKGEVRDSNGNLIVDLDAAGSDGLIPVPPAGTTIVLEKGVTVSFDTEPAGSAFKAKDYWLFAARTADASVEILDKAPPVGIHHHYGRLALVSFPASVTDCRVLWPPDTKGVSCDCTVCITAEAHNDGTGTIQQAIDLVKAEGGTVCLGPGIYNLGETTIRIDGAQSLRFHGQGWRTLLVYMGSGPAIAVQNSLGVTVEEMSIVTSGIPTDTSPDLLLRNCAGLTLQRCFFLQVRRGDGGKQAVGLSGLLLDTHLRENVILAAGGVGSILERGAATGAVLVTEFPPLTSPLTTAELYIEDNLLFCSQRGISLVGYALHTGETRITGNTLSGCSQGGIVTLGWVLPGSGVDIKGNELRAAGPGIVVGVDGARIADNDISPAAPGQGGDGIVLAAGLDRDGMNACQIISNRVIGVGGHGILIDARVRSAMIKQNVIEGAAEGGIVMGAGGSADNLSVENNQLINIAPLANDPKKPVSGIRLLRTDQAEVASNTISGLGANAVQSPSRVGIQVAASSSVRIAGNEVVDVGPAQFVSYSAGIEIFSPFERIDVVDNVVRRSQRPPKTPDSSSWFALRIRGPSVGIVAVGLDFSSGLFAVATNPSLFAIANNTNVIAVDNNIGYVLTSAANLIIVGTLIRVLPRDREIVGVRGNLFEAYGDVPAVAIAGEGAFILSDNRCLLQSNRSGLAAAVVAAGAVIANANYLEGPKGNTALIVQVPTGPFTIVGNIVSGSIQANGSPLDAPWAPLNVIAA